jgi:hypothetical protein
MKVMDIPEDGHSQHVPLDPGIKTHERNETLFFSRGKLTGNSSFVSISKIAILL